MLRNDQNIQKMFVILQSVEGTNSAKDQAWCKPLTVYSSHNME